MAGSNSVEIRYSILCISDKYFGVEVKYMREVTLLPVFTSVPHVPPLILGVFNLRGKINSIIDISPFLNLPLKDVNANDFIVLIEYQKTRIGVVVDKVLDVLAIDMSKTKIPTRGEPLNLINYTNGYYDHKKFGRIFLLDMESIFQSNEIKNYSFA